MTETREMRLPFWAEAPAELAGLVAYEAMVLDLRRFDEWLGMFTDDCLYWVPVDPDETNPHDTLNHVYDDHRRMEDRVARIFAGAHTEDPPGRTTRVLGPSLARGDGTDGVVELWTSFHLLHVRHEFRHVFGGNYRHRFVNEGGRWLIKEKRVGLVEADGALPAMTIVL
jgi:3-phenylpropionate/cinnamic acid dioxygenase small subunit